MTDVVTAQKIFKNSAGKWEGEPFSDTPPWLTESIESGNMGIIPNSSTKYAIWAAKTSKGIVVVEPGDKLSDDLMFGLVVEKHSLNRLTWDQIKAVIEQIDI